MADIILDENDFLTGKYQIAFDEEADMIIDSDPATELDESITRVQNDVLKRFLGVELKATFDSEYVNPPYDIRWVNLIDGLIYDSNQYGEKIEFEGLREALMAFTYADYQKKTRSFNTRAGQVFTNKENTLKVNPYLQKIIENKSFNDGVVIYKMARDYVYQEKDSYNTWRFSPLRFRNE